MWFNHTIVSFFLLKCIFSIHVLQVQDWFYVNIIATMGKTFLASTRTAIWQMMCLDWRSLLILMTRSRYRHTFTGRIMLVQIGHHRDPTREVAVLWKFSLTAFELKHRAPRVQLWTMKSQSNCHIIPEPWVLLSKLEFLKNIDDIWFLLEKAGTRRKTENRTRRLSSASVSFHWSRKETKILWFLQRCSIIRRRRWSWQGVKRKSRTEIGKGSNWTRKIEFGLGQSHFEGFEGTSKIQNLETTQFRSSQCISHAIGFEGTCLQAKVGHSNMNMTWTVN